MLFIRLKKYIQTKLKVILKPRNFKVMAASLKMHINSLILDYGLSTVNLHAYSAECNVINNLNVPECIYLYRLWA